MSASDHDDFAAIAADDALLDALFCGERDIVDTDRASSDDELAQLLRQWRHELDTAVAAQPARGTAVLVASAALPAESRRGWVRRHAVSAAAASAVVLAGTTGAAAAEGRHSGPLAAVHRVLFGQSHPHDIALVARVAGLLDGVAADLHDARAQGGATAAQISDMGDRLDHAGSLLAADKAAPTALIARLVDLRARLAALDTLQTAPPAVGGDTSGQPARDPGETGSHGPSTGAHPDGRDGSSPGGDGSQTGKPGGGAGGAGGSGAGDGSSSGSGTGGPGTGGSGTGGSGTGGTSASSGSGGAGSTGGGSGSGSGASGSVSGGPSGSGGDTSPFGA